MHITPGRSRLIAVVCATFLGVLMGFWLYGWDVINPTNVDWLLLEGDPFQHFIGWDAFRRDEWRLPLGAIPRLGTLIDASIVFTDSVPLLALPLKIFHEWLPDPFQYQGLIMLLNLVLNAVVSCLVAQRLGASALPSLLFAALVLLSPIVLMRGLGAHGHEALTAHWLIIAALGMALTFHDSLKACLAWLALLLVAVMVHFYLFFMVGAIWGAWWSVAMFRQANDVRREGMIRLVVFAVLNILAALSVMWLLGYFQYGLDVGRETGFGYFSAEALTYLNPLSQAWFFNGTGLHGASRVLPGWQSPIAGQYEGQAYAGLGMLSFVMVALCVAIRYVNVRDFSMIGLERWMVALILLGLFLFALADRWVIGKLVWDIPYPDGAVYITQYLRSSGRLVWPLFYGILLLGVAYLAHRIRTRNLAFILGVALIIQWADMKPLNHFIRKGLAERVAATRDAFPYQVITDARMAALLESHEEIRYLPGDDMGRLKPYLWLATRHDVLINVAYFARVNSEALLRATRSEVAEISEGKLDPKSVYVLTNSSLAHETCEKEHVTCFSLDSATIASLE
ncbi:DUF6311 domain-containing protein [Halomonas sp. WWR20]